MPGVGVPEREGFAKAAEERESVVLGEQQAGASSPRAGQEDPGSGVLTLFLALLISTSPRSRSPLEMAPNPAGNGLPGAGGAGVMCGLH